MPNTHSTFFTYDAFGRVTNANSPSSKSETYAYDANNNLTSKTDRKGQTIVHMSDDLKPTNTRTLRNQRVRHPLTPFADSGRHGHSGMLRSPNRCKNQRMHKSMSHSPRVATVVSSRSCRGVKTMGQRKVGHPPMT